VLQSNDMSAARRPLVDRNIAPHVPVWDKSARPDSNSTKKISDKACLNGEPRVVAGVHPSDRPIDHGANTRRSLASV
jgi:hypothetical protein